MCLERRRRCCVLWGVRWPWSVGVLRISVSKFVRIAPVSFREALWGNQAAQRCLGASRYLLTVVRLKGGETWEYLFPRPSLCIAAARGDARQELVGVQGFLPLRVAPERTAAAAQPGHFHGMWRLRPRPRPEERGGKWQGEEGGCGLVPSFAAAVQLSSLLGHTFVGFYVVQFQTRRLVRRRPT